MSPSKSCVIGVDVGTTGVRAVAVDHQDIEVASSKYLYSDFSEKQSGTGAPALWWYAVEQTLHTLIDFIKGYEIIAISVDGTSGTVLPIDEKGEPLAEPLMYNDVVDDHSILESIASAMPDTSAAGGATSGLAKAIYFCKTKPHRIIHQADWIVGKLTGEYIHSDANNALKTGFDPVRMCWPDWISEISDVLTLLPEVATPGDIVGTISSFIAARFKLPAGVKVVAGTTDGCAAFLATGASETGDAVTSLGSTLTLKLLSDQPVFYPEFGIYSHRIGDVWLAGGASNTGGAVLAHYFSKEEIKSLSRDIAAEQRTGLDYYPLLNPGERFPINDPELVPRLQPRPDSKITFLQGILEGIASIEKLGYEQLVAVGAPEIKCVRSVGGGAANAVFTKIRKSKLDTEFKTTLSEDAAFGVALLAKRTIDRLELW